MKLTWDEYDNADPRDDHFVPYGVDKRLDGWAASITLTLRGHKTREDAQATCQRIENSIKATCPIREAFKTLQSGCHSCIKHSADNYTLCARHQGMFDLVGMLTAMEMQ